MTVQEMSSSMRSPNGHDHVKTTHISKGVGKLVGKRRRLHSFDSDCSLLTVSAQTEYVPN